MFYYRPLTFLSIVTLSLVSVEAISSGYPPTPYNQGYHQPVPQQNMTHNYPPTPYNQGQHQAAPQQNMTHNYPPTPYNQGQHQAAPQNTTPTNTLETALQEAVSKNDTQQVKALIVKGAKINATNSGGLTPLHWAAMNKNLELIKFLVEKGANLNAKANSGQTPSDKACSAGSPETCNLFKELSEKKVTSTETKASQSQGTNKQELNKQLQSALLKGANLVTIQNFIKEGADLTTKEEKNNVNLLHIAAIAATLDVNKFLIESGKIDINEKNIVGKTPLYYALSNKNPKVVRLYLDKGANPDIKDNDGKAPRDYATEKSPETQQYFKIEEAFKYFNLPASSNFEEVTKKYKTLSLRYHPDKNIGMQEEAKKKFQELNEYYSTLKTHFGK